MGCTKIMPTYMYMYFTCDLALIDGAGGERIDEISVCGAPGLKTQQIIIIISYANISSSKMYLLIRVT